MIDTPRILQAKVQQTAVIRVTVPREQIRDVIGPAIGEVIGVVSAPGIRPAGSVVAHHLRMDPATFDFEVGVPVLAAVTATGPVRLGQPNPEVDL